MEKIRLIAMDMDGTLLSDTGKTIPQENVNALAAAHKAGVQLALCSGRIPDDMGFYALDTGVPMHILALNGTCSLDGPLGAVTRSDSIPDHVAREVFRLIKQFPVAYGIFSDHDLVVSSVDMSEQYLEIIFGANILREGTRTKIHTGGQGAEDMLNRGVNKFMIFTENDARPLQELCSILKNNIPEVEVSSSWINNLEVNGKGANKGAALRALAQRLNIPMSAVMAIGDNDNDIPMLEAAGIGVAMGNATANALSVADYVTLPNHQHGVAAAIRALALGEAIPGVRRLK